MSYPTKETQPNAMWKLELDLVRNKQLEKKSGEQVRNLSMHDRLTRGGCVYNRTAF